MNAANAASKPQDSHIQLTTLSNAPCIDPYASVGPYVVESKLSRSNG